MGKLLKILTPLHRRIKRSYLDRIRDDKIKCMGIAGKYGKDYWDGQRKYGYGGYYYDGRWAPVAKKLVKIYRLKKNARILDVGCGKGYLLYEFKKILPKSYIVGFDISGYAIKNSKEEIKGNLFVYNAQGRYPFKNNEFDLVLSLTTLHNLFIFEIEAALREIERTGKNKYISMESFRNEKELFNLQCWALTCKSFFTPKEWLWLFDRSGYGGDYEFIYFP